MGKIAKKIAKTFTNTLTTKCAIMDLLGCREDFRRPSIIPIFIKKKRLFRDGTAVLYSKKFLHGQQFFCLGAQFLLHFGGGGGGITDGGDIRLYLGLGAGGAHDQAQTTL